MRILLNCTAQSENSRAVTVFHFNFTSALKVDFVFLLYADGCQYRAFFCSMFPLCFQNTFEYFNVCRFFK